MNLKSKLTQYRFIDYGNVHLKVNRKKRTENFKFLQLFV